MSTLKRISVDLELGQTILVGPNDSPARITKIEYHENSGEIVIGTTRGTRRVLTFKLADSGLPVHPADRYR
jgi:hypothetical protein